MLGLEIIQIEKASGNPKRVVRAYEQFFAGYDKDPKEVLSKVFEEVEGYDEMVIVKDIRVESHCEHHMVPILERTMLVTCPTRELWA